MRNTRKLLTIIAARGASKGLPGKNIRSLAGLPLIAHSILLGRMCPDIDRLIVSTDSEEIADVARAFGAEVPFLRPTELAQDNTPLWTVLRHALEAMERLDGVGYEFVQLLDPTAPARLPADIANAFKKLESVPSADGIIFVSRPDFSPIWHGVVERDGWLEDLFPEAAGLHRRQDVPTVYRIISTANIWRASFMRHQELTWRGKGKHLFYEIPKLRAIDIDDEDSFERAEALIKAGLIKLPWLDGETYR